jgi:acylphosphatase
MFGRLWRRSARETAKDQSMERRTVHVIISGRVQGVGYRAWTHREATARRLSGWVCNRRDGAVEAVFSGNAEAVDAMMAAVRHGPSGARVDRVDVVDCDDIQPGPFAVRPTY